MTRTSFKKTESGRTKFVGDCMGGGRWAEVVSTARVANKRVRKEGKKICKNF